VLRKMDVSSAAELARTVAGLDHESLAT